MSFQTGYHPSPQSYYGHAAPSQQEHYQYDSNYFGAATPSSPQQAPPAAMVLINDVRLNVPETHAVAVPVTGVDDEQQGGTQFEPVAFAEPSSAGGYSRSSAYETPSTQADVTQQAPGYYTEYSPPEDLATVPMATAQHCYSHPPATTSSTSSLPLSLSDRSNVPQTPYVTNPLPSSQLQASSSSSRRPDYVRPGSNMTPYV
mmetsp:Transcript_114753/g.331621  ORF Transcript_114753/g.331621 Transcript_114753/m.331621 type:complete len:202 (+) Transcript_114753:111-716(+)